ncbi:MAG TPA: DsrH/TusB family sulfur metabolism protein [Thermoplasmata archaeon]|nr:DsrH/TusB family sulfur metabolism protein [Thermoplasmata archaeon]
MASSILVLITRPPYGLEEAFAGLRLALSTGVNGMKTSVVLMEDGVYNAVASQKSEILKMPSNVEATKDLYDFDVQVLVVKEDLASRGIQESRLFDGLKVIPREQLKEALSEHDIVTTF